MEIAKAVLCDFIYWSSKQCLYVFNILNDLKIEYQGNVITDNQSSKIIALLSASLRKKKHMDIKHMFIQKFIRLPEVTLNYLATTSMEAD